LTQKKLKGYPDVVNIGCDWMNSHTEALFMVNVVERPVAMNFYSKAFPGLGGAILFGNFSLGFSL